MNEAVGQGTRATVSPGNSQAEILGPPTPTQAEILGAPTSSTYGWNRSHLGRRPSMPRWYATLCDGWSRAVWHGEMSWEHAAVLVGVWHPVALEQALTPGSRRRLGKQQQLELELFAGLLTAGVDETTARHLVGLNGDTADWRQEGARDE
jgi:hypothetical protein